MILAVFASGFSYFYLRRGVMLFAVAVAFGWKIGLPFALSVFAIAADRWGIIGGSWFRYAWLAALTLGIAALRRGSYAVAGVFMALSTLLNGFPIVFSVGLVIRGIVTCWQERRLVPRYRRFVLAALVTSLIGIGVGLLPARHVDNYSVWAANMVQHNTERFRGRLHRCSPGHRPGRRTGALLLGAGGLVPGHVRSRPARDRHQRAHDAPLVRRD